MEPLASLGEFFTSDQDELAGEELNSEEKKMLEEIEQAMTQFSEQLKSEPCADITYTGKCGFANAGQRAYLRNLRRDRRVTVTVEVHSRRIGYDRTTETTKTISAGGKVSLGCTASATMPVTYHSFKIVGCEVH